MTYKKEQKHINTEDRIFLEAEIKRLKDKKEEIDKKIARVKNWLDKMDDRGKTVLEEFYINNKGKNWNKVVKKYNSLEEKELTKRQLIDIRDDSLEKILKIVNV